jgi:diguanylate cyclase (GGDEF)-like protein/PAS domain S-box-containing protein
MALLAIVFFALPVTITLTMKHESEQSGEAVEHLLSGLSELRVQDGLEWRAISGRATPADVRTDLAASRATARDHLTEAVDQGLPSAAADRITEASQRYSKAVDEELRLISTGDQQKALKFDETGVDPAFGDVEGLVASQTEQMESTASRTQRLSDAGVLLTVLLSMILVSVVQGRRRRMEVRQQSEKESETRYRSLIDQSADLVLVVDRSGRADFVSPSVERLLAHPSPESLLVGHPPSDNGSAEFITRLDPQDRTRLMTALQVAHPVSTYVGEFDISGKDGTRTFEVFVQDLTTDLSVGGIVLTAHDVTDRAALELEMQHLALHDTLTGLPNRLLLAERFEQVLRAAERDGSRVGLLLLDLDRFKEVNDTFGHHYGDELLRQIGPRLVGELRGIDTVARLGGDEFAVLLPHVHGVNDATNVAAALLAALAIPFHVEGVDMDVEASVGVVISGEHGQDLTALLQHADIAMYIAKTQHLGVFVYDRSVDVHSATKLALVGDLRRALNLGELLLYYQPKVSVSTGEVVGAEALVRWQHPEHGLILPDAFIPLAERTGLIGPLTEYVLNEALSQARTWLAAGRQLPIAVNLSARNLHDDRFVDKVAELLAVHDVPALLLQLEVTESALMIDPAKARQTLDRLSALGIWLSIDDFGAGYTSLSQLAIMPVNEIKIDRSFVTTMVEDPSNAVIVTSVVDLGHNLGLKLVAEGVETESALSALRGLGCDVAQGYFLSRPISADAFDIWCAERPVAAARPQHI